MTQWLQASLDRFRKKINLLILDDDEFILESLTQRFSSPLFNVVPAGSYDQAVNAVENIATRWHCMILDIDLGGVKSGLTLLQKFSHYPFAIILSGLRSMTLATEAIHAGACAVVDKDPSSVKRLYGHVCKTAALGFLLNGRSSPHLETFRLLQDPAIDSVDAWAARSGITQRKLYRICEVHPPLTPYYALALYRAIYFLLGLTENAGIPPGFTIPPGFSPKEQNLYSEWGEHLLHHYKG